MESNKNKQDAGLNINRLVQIFEVKGYNGLFQIFEVGTAKLDQLLELYLDQTKGLPFDRFPVHVHTVTHCSKIDGAFVKCGFTLEHMMSGIQPIQMQINHFEEGGAIVQSHLIKLYNEKQIPHKEMANKLVSLDFSIKNSKRLKI